MNLQFAISRKQKITLLEKESIHHDACCCLLKWLSAQAGGRLPRARATADIMADGIMGRAGLASCYY
jgi:hypothetical protein